MYGKPEWVSERERANHSVEPAKIFVGEAVGFPWDDSVVPYSNQRIPVSQFH
jgi:hypothetical protein